MKQIRKQQLIYSLLLSVIISIGLIIHGIFLDLDFSQLERFTLGGFIVTYIIVFIFLYVIEKLFDLNNEEEISELRKRLNKLENQVKKDT
ncbi:MAG: hypothetical protein ACOCUU_01670 [Nanoarchaeota archaeon]